MQGLHLTADLYKCACPARLLTDAEQLAALCREATLRSGLTIVDEKWHTFPDYQGQPGGVTGALLLMESHLAIHTWPERGGVTLDVYVCNFASDNSSKAQQVMDEVVAALKPGRAQHEHLLRGDADGPAAQGELILEPMNDTSAYGFRFTRRLLTRKTRYQLLEILESPHLGRCMRLDGAFMTSEADEFFYHETLVHPAAIAHPRPRTALVIGGGDGGALEELLKHPSIEAATLVELDREVVEAAREHLGNIHRGALDDPRVTLRYGNGLDHVANTAERYDLVFLDLTDPGTPADPLYTRAFFEKCRAILAPGGAMVLHLGAPFYDDARIRRQAGDLAAVFRRVDAFGVHVPLYGSYWGMAIVSDELDPLAIDAGEVARRLEDRGIGALQYYNEGVHGALFALPTFYRNLLPRR